MRQYFIMVYVKENDNTIKVLEEPNNPSLQQHM